jgi:hypothetical protein
LRQIYFFPMIFNKFFYSFGVESRKQIQFYGNNLSLTLFIFLAHLQ